ncbi:MAG: hypothetical protein HY363_01380 [Candidatus Aenigmarchaeota archaeon]|nr:hypothetical protein [Candidatus Aenigmarchaeota archaeon]
MNRRNRLEIIHDMLRVTNDLGGKILPTHLLYKSNLSHERMKGYIEELKQKQLLMEMTEKDKIFFAITEQGRRFLMQYKQLTEFAEAFGL